MLSGKDVVRCIILTDKNLHFYCVNTESTQIILVQLSGFCFKEFKFISFVTNGSLEREIFVISKKKKKKKIIIKINNKKKVYFIKIYNTNFAKRCDNYKTITLLKAVTLCYLKRKWH